MSADPRIEGMAYSLWNVYRDAALIPTKWAELKPRVQEEFRGYAQLILERSGRSGGGAL